MWCALRWNASFDAGKRLPLVIVNLSLPAAANGIVSMGAIGRGLPGYEIAEFSNINPAVYAPGVGIVSAKVGGGLIAMSGTSMAAPHVAWVAVLWSEALHNANRRTKVELVRSKLLANCQAHGFASGVIPFDIGAGLVLAPPPL